MKKRKNLGAKIVAFISLLALVVGTFSVGISFLLQAQENERAQKIEQEIIKEYDLDGNGQLNDEERINYLKDRGFDISTSDIEVKDADDTEVKAEVTPVEETNKTVETPSETETVSE